MRCSPCLTADCGGTIVLVGQDGVQRPPIHFPKGGHLLAFLSCLENGLLPHGQLDPPLWSQRGKGTRLISDSSAFMLVWTKSAIGVKTVCNTGNLMEPDLITLFFYLYIWHIFIVFALCFLKPCSFSLYKAQV